MLLEENGPKVYAVLTKVQPNYYLVSSESHNHCHDNEESSIPFYYTNHYSPIQYPSFLIPSVVTPPPPLELGNYQITCGNYPSNDSLPNGQRHESNLRELLSAPQSDNAPDLPIRYVIEDSPIEIVRRESMKTSDGLRHFHSNEDNYRSIAPISTNETPETFIFNSEISDNIGLYENQKPSGLFCPQVRLTPETLLDFYSIQNGAYSHQQEQNLSETVYPITKNPSSSIQLKQPVNSSSTARNGTSVSRRNINGGRTSGRKLLKQQQSSMPSSSSSSTPSVEVNGNEDADSSYYNFSQLQATTSNSTANNEKNDDSTVGEKVDSVTCLACANEYTDKRALINHIGRSEKCREIIGKNYNDELIQFQLHEMMPELSKSNSNPVCPYCNHFISSYSGNIRRHINQCKKNQHRENHQNLHCIPSSDEPNTAAPTIGCDFPSGTGDCTISAPDQQQYLTTASKTALVMETDDHMPSNIKGVEFSASTTISAVSGWSSYSDEGENSNLSYQSSLLMYGDGINNSHHNNNKRNNGRSDAAMDDNPYECAWCKFITIYKANMKRHLLTCHQVPEQSLIQFDIQRLRQKAENRPMHDELPTVPRNTRTHSNDKQSSASFKSEGNITEYSPSFI